MRKWQRVMEAAAVVAMLSLTACSGGGGSDDSSVTGENPPPVTPSSIEGQVADGYLRGATVCLDVNGNKKCDAGEPTATSGASGAFIIAAEELAKLNGADPALYPIVVEVVEGAVDEDTITVENPAGTPITAPYVLSAPAGKPEFVSPITTLVQSQIESNPGLSVAEAEAAVKGQIGVSEDVSLFENYVEPEDQGKAAKLETMHKVAQVVARTMADMKSQLETAAVSAGIDLDDNYDAIVKLVVEEVMDRLTTIVAKVEESGTGFDPDDVKDATITETGSVEAETITQRIEEKKTVVAKGSFLSMLAGDGVFWIDMWFDRYMPRFEYGNVKADEQGNPVDAHYNREGESWVLETTPEAPDFLLTAQGWVEFGEEASNYAISQQADGSILLTHKETEVQEKLIAVEYDLSGKAHNAFSGERSERLLSPTATFPAGAKGYKLTFIPQQDIYSVHTWTDDYQPGVDQNYVRYHDQSGQEVPLTTLESLLSMFNPAAGIKRYLTLEGSMGQDLSVQFAQGGQLLLFKTSWTQGQVSALPLERTGTWSEITVHATKLVKLNLPDAYRAMFRMGGSPFYVVKDGKVKRGEYLAAGVVDHDDEFNFNKAAFDSLMGNIDFSYVPSTGEITPGPASLALRR